eukprot:scaffold1453_cov195-Amphora_coffeaeformis.AAC.7
MMMKLSLLSLLTVGHLRHVKQLTDCSTYDHGIDVHLDDDDSYTAILRLRADPDQCMQATHGGVLERGAWLCINPCDATNPLQRFEALGTLQLENTDWFVAYWGTTANLGEDHLMLRKYRTVDYEWSHD